MEEFRSYFVHTEQVVKVIKPTVNTEDLKKKIEHELADVLFSVCVLADKLDVDLEDSFARTMNQLEQRIQEDNDGGKRSGYR